MDLLVTSNVEPGDGCEKCRYRDPADLSCMVFRCSTRDSPPRPRECEEARRRATALVNERNDLLAVIDDAKAGRNGWPTTSTTAHPDALRADRREPGDV